MRINADALLLAAVAGEEGRGNVFGFLSMTRDLSTSLMDLRMGLHKFGGDESVSCASLASDTDAHRYLTEALFAAQVAVNQAREMTTALYIAELRKAGRIQ